MQSYHSYLDADLVALLKEDDENAYAELYNRYERLLFLHACKRLKNTEEARDIIHDIFVTLWRRRKELDVKGEFRVYLFVSVRNRIFDLIARQKNRDCYVESVKHFARTTDISTDYAVRHNQLLAMIEKEIAALPPRMRQVFELSRMEHLAHKEIANRLNISEGTVKNHVKGALKVLKAKLGPLFFLLF